MNGAGVSASTASRSPARGAVSSADIFENSTRCATSLLLLQCENLQRSPRENPGEAVRDAFLSHVLRLRSSQRLVLTVHGSLLDTKLRDAFTHAGALRLESRHLFRSAVRMHACGQVGEGGGGGGFHCSQVKVSSKIPVQSNLLPQSNYFFCFLTCFYSFLWRLSRMRLREGHRSFNLVSIITFAVCIII